MNRSKSLAMISVGFLTGYMFTKTVKWGLFLGWTVLVFLLGMGVDTLMEHVKIIY